MAYKIALNAGHGMSTLGKRCHKSLDPNQTRENYLNRRICDKIEDKLNAYQDYVLIRCDDVTGKKDYSLTKRTSAANQFGADIYISIHHNAAGKLFSGSGIEAYVYTKVDEETEAMQEKLYDNIIKHTGLKGNRSDPLRKAAFTECKKTIMPCVLLECGYMDSVIDVPIILSDTFADQVATAIVEVLVKEGKLTKKKVQPSKEKLSITYQVWDDARNQWLPNVTDLEDYAGIFGHGVCCVYASLNKGNVFYKVHIKGGKWLPEVKNRGDYAGAFNKPIDAIMFKTDTGKTIHYAVHLKKSNKWLPFVTGYDTKDNNNGYAGIIGQEIDAIKVYID